MIKLTSKYIVSVCLFFSLLSNNFGNYKWLKMPLLIFLSLLIAMKIIYDIKKYMKKKKEENN